MQADFSESCQLFSLSSIRLHLCAPGYPGFLDANFSKKSASNVCLRTIFFPPSSLFKRSSGIASAFLSRGTLIGVSLWGRQGQGGFTYRRGSSLERLIETSREILLEKKLFCSQIVMQRKRYLNYL
ncbi:hypothetical protein CDAR_508601 [Caerostris darwini]|uniref:Uncharacterized protein n=1 Tax=Caerostris darwini TaxID=1538125 RepID=A0AAV4N3H1_9ARAC|nr:hypothetical protein CDAR_508601 [Caerostris darwini]